MKICMLTSGHDIYDNRIYYKEILSLRKKYDEIYLVAPGVKDFVTEEGIVVKCFEKRKSWHDRFRPMKDMYKIALEIKADVYHAHEPDSFQVALKLKKALNSKAIYDSHEYHPEAFAEHFKVGKPVFEKLIYLYEKTMGKKADCIISVNNLLIDKFSGYNKKTALIPNYPVIHNEDFHKEYGDTPTFVYAGGLREDRGIMKVLEAIKLVDKPYKYIFIGPFETVELENKIKEFIDRELGNRDITFTGKIPHPKVFDYLRMADAGFVLLQPENWRYVNSEPIKLFEYMMTKTVVLASDFPMMRAIVEESQCGLLVKPDDPIDIARAISTVGENREETKVMGERGFSNVSKLYNWDIIEKRLLKVYEDLS